MTETMLLSTWKVAPTSKFESVTQPYLLSAVYIPGFLSNPGDSTMNQTCMKDTIHNSSGLSEVDEQNTEDLNWRNAISSLLLCECFK